MLQDDAACCIVLPQYAQQTLLPIRSCTACWNAGVGEKFSDKIDVRRLSKIQGALLQRGATACPGFDSWQAFHIRSTDGIRPRPFRTTAGAAAIDGKASSSLDREVYCCRPVGLEIFSASGDVRLFMEYE